MKKNYNLLITRSIFMAFLLLSCFQMNAQDTIAKPKEQSEFRKKLQFGGGLGLNFSGGTNVSFSPNVIYNANKYVSFGAGLQTSYVATKNFKSSFTIGANLTALANPFKFLQMSFEFEQLRSNSVLENTPDKIKVNAWDTAMFLGGGIRIKNYTIGAKYNFLYNEEKSIYSSAMIPFVRVYL